LLESCIVKREKATISNQFSVGGFIPKCKTDGSYEEKQCRGSTGFCWCVDSKSGKEIPDTRKGPGSSVACGTSCIRPCPRIYKPVCGSDGETYDNYCLFNNTKCENKGLTVKEHRKCRVPIIPGRQMLLAPSLHFEAASNF